MWRRLSVTRKKWQSIQEQRHSNAYVLNNSLIDLSDSVAYQWIQRQHILQI